MEYLRLLPQGVLVCTSTDTSDTHIYFMEFVWIIDLCTEHFPDVSSLIVDGSFSFRSMFFLTLQSTSSRFSELPPLYCRSFVAALNLLKPVQGPVVYELGLRLENWNILGTQLFSVYLTNVIIDVSASEWS